MNESKELRKECDAASMYGRIYSLFDTTGTVSQSVSGNRSSEQDGTADYATTSTTTTKNTVRVVVGAATPRSFVPHRWTDEIGG